MLVRDNNGRHYPLSFYAPMSLHSFPSDNEAAYIRLYPVLDALSLLFLQPEKVLSPIPVIPDATVTVFIIADLYEKLSVTLTSPFPCICRFPLEYNR